MPGCSTTTIITTTLHRHHFSLASNVLCALSLGMGICHPAALVVVCAWDLHTPHPLAPLPRLWRLPAPILSVYNPVQVTLLPMALLPSSPNWMAASSCSSATVPKAAANSFIYVCPPPLPPPAGVVS